MACTTMKFGKKFFENVQTVEKNIEKKPQPKNNKTKNNKTKNNIEINDDDCSEFCYELCNLQ